MMPSRAIVLALAMACICGPAALAQSAQQCNDFVKIRADADQKANAIRAASQRKAEPKELCGLFQRFAAAEDTMVKFLEANKLWCGVPDVAIKQAKLGHEKTVKMRTAVCNGGTIGGEASRPRPPSLSDALNAPSVDTPSNTKTGRGTFDTLTGSPLAR
jgi:hypothetical protein